LEEGIEREEWTKRRGEREVQREKEEGWIGFSCQPRE